MTAPSTSYELTAEEMLPRALEWFSSNPWLLPVPTSTLLTALDERVVDPMKVLAFIHWTAVTATDHADDPIVDRDTLASTITAFLDSQWRHAALVTEEARSRLIVAAALL